MKHGRQRSGQQLLGCVCVTLLGRFDRPFVAALPIVAAGPTLVGVVLERTLYRCLYGASYLD